MTAKSDGTAGSAPALEYVRWTDPREFAFSVHVPQGWSVNGGTFTFHPSDRRHSVEVVSPEESVRVQIGDANVPPFSVPDTMGVMFGFTEGRWYSPGYGLQMWVQRYLSGTQFAQWYITTMRRLPNVAFTEVRDRPDWLQAHQATQPLFGGMFQATLTAGEATFTFGDRNAPRWGYCLAGTQLTQTFGTGIWNVEFLYQYTAVPEQWAVAGAVLRRMIDSFAVDANWSALRQKSAARSSEIVTRTNAEIREMMDESYRHRQRVQDDIARKWSNYIRDQTDVIDPRTGDTGKVTAGSRYYWRRGDTVIGTETYERPGIDWEPLKEW
jgi:hypothetical protein